MRLLRPLGIFCVLPALFVLFAGSADLAVWAKKKKATDEQPSEKEEEKWEVENPPGDPYEVQIDTTEGTWMNLDVSPDGEQIVFDLLGDIFVMPIEGGSARALTDGFAWDMQPRFSPNGKWIAFTSDRGGGDNIWVMKRDGTDPREVSTEDFRLLNNPAWSPDGEFIAARKHFTSRRSLGAGEIWLYHRSGGDGLQLTKRPNDQKDLGEPAFSPDGRYVYFSRDTTPGDRFQYDKDSNTEIYTIRRLDRETGEIEPFVTGPGGAVRPTPSPDGNSMAFIRRVRYRTALFVQEIESGETRVLYDAMERDKQETWAVHGVYPNIAWTPDNRSIVFWADGKIRRIDVESAEVDEIPFRVEKAQKMLEALRFPVEVAPERFYVKMLRWVRVSPAGDKVVFQALGHLYVRELPEGTATRLTNQNDHFEFYPSWSRDGRWIVYTTWNDDTLGSVRVASAGGLGGEGRVLSSQPGHFVEPAFSPEGSHVVYRKTRGGYVRSRLYSRDTGLYVVPVEGGEPEKLIRSGARPHFGSENDRVYFQGFESEDKRSLRSIELDGSDERTHLSSEAATEFRVSPDGRWVAFTERFNAYVAPFVATGKAVDLGPKTKSIPVRQVSRDAGEYLQWSGASDRLYWSLGPELYRRDLKDAFAFMDGAPEELPEPPETGVDLGWSELSDVPSGKIALVGGRVVTMQGDEVIENGTVLVDRNRIVRVGPVDQVEVPPGTLTVDVSGNTLIPGLVDAHWHGRQGSSEITPQQNWFNFSSLAFGVTTIHDPSNDTSTFFAASELGKAGIITGPRLFSTGTILYGAAGDFKAIVNSLDDARSHLRRMKAVGAFSVKSYNQPRRDQRQQIITAARELEMMVVPEGGALYQHNMSMIVDGHTGIEHSLPIANVYEDVLQLWSNSRVGYTPTLVVGYGGLGGENYWYHKTDVWANERLLAFVPRFAVDPRSRRRQMAPDEEYNHIDIAKGCKQLADRGVSVQLGAHGQREGLGAHWEMWMFEQGGMTPLEALRASTLNGAWYIGMDGDIGSIEEGKLADIVVLERNPLENIRNSEYVRYTMINGRLYDAATMDQIGNHPTKRKKFFWEE
jgi:imidazolonepropionase-like amidohydrolase/Tol biopolymer transport system component